MSSLSDTPALHLLLLQSGLHGAELLLGAAEQRPQPVQRVLVPQTLPATPSTLQNNVFVFALRLSMQGGGCDMQEESKNAWGG